MAQYRDLEDLLFAYAAGDLPPALSMVVAAHLTLSPDSRAEVARLEAIGGAVLEEIEPEPASTASLDAVLRRLDEPAPAIEAVVPAAADADPTLPRPLRERLGMKLADVPWRQVGPLGEYRLDDGDAAGRVRLLKIPAGRAMPRHTHVGTEATLVLTGGFSDESGHFVRGDLAVVDEQTNHQPVADAGEDCICLAVSTGPVRLTGKMGRFLNPFFEF